METVRAINVPMYTTLRSTAVAFTMIEYLLTGQKHSLRIGRSKTESTVAVPILVANLAKICSILTSRTQEKPQVSLTMPKMTWHSSTLWANQDCRCSEVTALARTPYFYHIYRSC
ncbi:hypothetical protein H0E87_013261 [Populus deltoides]|uniref:Uncharacterized protein n=1 Tax=Populus deltoides TaxID=3696 RepID=A0A8T2YN57_POPDE|nr:hypothetical protein H0E87_013261 [Populus deltoides]